MNEFTVKIVIVMVCCIIGYFVMYPGTSLSVEDLQQDKIIKYQQELQRTAQSLKGQPSAADYYRMHIIYYNGIPDKYDNNGNKVKGVEPDPGKAIYYLIKSGEAAADGTTAVPLWMKLASIYQNGMYNLDPDLERARAVCVWIMNKYPYQNIQWEVQDRLTEITTEINNIQTYRWLNLKYTPKKNTHHEKIKALLNKGRTNSTPNHPWEGRGTTAMPAGGIFRATDAPITDINAVGYNDTHNTHNSQVVGTVANSIKKLGDSTEIRITVPETLREIRSFLATKPQCDKTADAYKSLDSIERNIIPIVSVNMKECEALNLVWNRINSDRHKEHVNDIKDMLYEQLADMQEHGKSVCATGRLSRIVDTFSTFDRDVQIKPTYVINKEMMEKAAKLRNDMYASVGSDAALVEKLKAGTAPVDVQDRFDRDTKAKILGELTKDYVDSGIMTESAFTKNVEQWIDEI